MVFIFYGEIDIAVGIDRIRPVRAGCVLYQPIISSTSDDLFGQTLYLRHIHGIRIFGTCCHPGNLTGIGTTAYRYCTISCFPRTIIDCRYRPGCKIIPCPTGLARCDRIPSQSNPAFRIDKA